MIHLETGDDSLREEDDSPKRQGISRLETGDDSDDSPGDRGWFT